MGGDRPGHPPTSFLNFENTIRGMDVNKRFVTLGGECFEAEFHGEERFRLTGNVHRFRLHDVRGGRGERLVSLFRSDQIKLLNPNYSARVEFARINIIRRAFDSGKLSFDEPYDQHEYKPLEMNDSDFSQQPLASDPEIRQFMIQRRILRRVPNTTLTRGSRQYSSRLTMTFLSPTIISTTRYSTC